MFLHLGGNTVVPLREVVTIVDLAALRGREGNPLRFFEQMKNRGYVVDLGEGEANSLVVTDKKVYLSPISSATLRRRAHFPIPEEELEGSVDGAAAGTRGELAAFASPSAGSSATARGAARAKGDRRKATRAKGTAGPLEK